MFKTDVARQFIDDAALPPDPLSDLGDESAEESVPFDTEAAPGAVVSSSLIAWDEDIPPDIRQAVSDSLLFAQLFADKSVPDRNDVEQWMTNYFTVLPRIGWTLTSDVRNETEEDALGSEVHQRILDLIAVVLGPIPTALAVVTSALMSLQRMAADSPWITLFNRRSKGATSAGLQVNAVQADNRGTASINGAAFRVEADRTLTQVLFFKFTSNRAKLYKRAISMSIDGDTLKELAATVQSRVRPFQIDFIKTLPI
jgi:hypothetical protein